MSNISVAKERFSPKAAFVSFRSNFHFGRRSGKNKTSSSQSMSRYISNTPPSASPSTQSLNSVNSSISFSSRKFTSQKRRTAPDPPELVENVVIKTYHHDMVKSKRIVCENTSPLPQDTPRRDDRVHHTGRRLFSEEDAMLQVQLVECEDSKTVISDYNHRIMKKKLESSRILYDTPGKLNELKLDAESKPAGLQTNRSPVDYSTEVEDQGIRRDRGSPLKFFDNTDKVSGRNVNFSVDDEKAHIKTPMNSDPVFHGLNKEYIKLGQLLLDWNNERSSSLTIKLNEIQKKVAKQIQLIDDLFKYNCLKERMRKTESGGLIEVGKKVEGLPCNKDGRSPRKNGFLTPQKALDASEPEVQIKTQSVNGDKPSGVYNWREHLKSPVKGNAPCSFKRSSGMRSYELEKPKNECSEALSSSPQKDDSLKTTGISPRKETQFENGFCKEFRRSGNGKVDSSEKSRNIYSNCGQPPITISQPKTWIIPSSSQRIKNQNDISENQGESTPVKSHACESPSPLGTKCSARPPKLRVELEPVELDSSMEEPVPVSVKVLLNEAEPSSECEDNSVQHILPSNPLHTIFEASEDNSEPDESAEREKLVLPRSPLVNVVRPSNSAPPPPPPLPNDLFTTKKKVQVVKSSNQVKDNSQKKMQKNDGDHLRHTWSQIMSDIRDHAAKRAQKAEQTS